MKILVISLLRVGDILMSAGVFKALKEKHEGSELHVLMNSQCASAAPMMPYIDRVHKFDREGLQKGLGENDVPFFNSFQSLESLIESLEVENFDLVVNITQNKISGWIMSLIPARERVGLCFDDGGRASFNSEWLEHLNRGLDFESSEVFHMNDIFRGALGLEKYTFRALQETLKGRSEAAHHLELFQSEKIVAMQVTTSDQKKNWSFESFAETAQFIHQREPNVEFAIFAAPSDETAVQPFVQNLKNRGVSARIVVISLEGALSFIHESDLFVTLDTSLKHLAASTTTPILEISLGSSDPFRTGAYRDGAYFVRSREACAPCVHSQPCHREAQFCAKRMGAEPIALIATELLAGRKFQFANVASEFSDSIELFEVDLKSSNLYLAVPPKSEWREDAVARIILRFVSALALNRRTGTPKERKMTAALQMGTALVELDRALHRFFPEVSETDWRHLFSEFEQQCRFVESRINGFKTGVRYLHGHFEDAKAMKSFVGTLISFRDKIRPRKFLEDQARTLDRIVEDDISPPFVRLRRIVDAVSEIEALSSISLGVLQRLQHQIEERAEVEIR